MSEPHKSESPAATGLIAENSIQEAAIVGADDGEGKGFASLRARAALAGFVVRRFGSEEGPAYSVSRWNLVRELRTLDDVSAWLDGATGTQPQHPGRRERERRALIDADNRRQDELDDAADLLRGPGGT